MYELKENGKVFMSKFVGTGPSSCEKRIYRATVSQRLRITGIDSHQCIIFVIAILTVCLSSMLHDICKCTTRIYKSSTNTSSLKHGHYFSTTLNFISNWRIKNQLDATYYFIVLLIGSTCFGHYYAHHHEVATMMLITTLVVLFLVCCMLEVRCG